MGYFILPHPVYTMTLQTQFRQVAVHKTAYGRRRHASILGGPNP